MSSEPRRTVRFLIFGASLHQRSINVRLARLASTIVREKGGVVDFAEFSEFDCPSYNYDLESQKKIPEGAQRLRDRLLENDAFMISTPEYNASMPGVLKNVIDWTSRIQPQPFNGKQGFLMSASPSMVGGNRGLWALRVPLEHLGSRVYPDMYSLAQANSAFSDTGRIANDMLQQRLETVIDCFLDLVEAAKHYRGIKKEWVEFLGERADESIDRVETSLSEVG
jgi:chromate reductase, NAD(P)H dehydrogenase (quinone)